MTSISQQRTSIHHERGVLFLCYHNVPTTMNSTKRYSNFASTQQWRTMNKMFVLALLLPWIAQQKPLQLVDASQTTSHRHLRKDTKINGEDKVNERIPNEDVIRNFVPLSCNSNINTTDCHKWSTKFGTHRIYNVRVIVPCGECITMDHKRDITFNDGLDIVGKLVFPDGYKVNVSSTMIVVQGVLEMKSTQPVTGTPSIRITMIGNNTENSFTPVDENANICAISTCVVGKKGIVVAGGTVDIHGVPPDTPTWVRMYDVAQGGGNSLNTPDTIYVPQSVTEKWEVGAQILITSHTMIWNATQVRTIADIWSFFGPTTGYIALKLSEPIVRPTTLIESSDFAVEVALLSRNIVFDGGPDDIPNHGGHLMVLYTPSVVQTIEGIDFRNFGQQGKLGRYPIHFHFCNDVSGSVVLKNTIRQSNQRCVVVHGTNKLRIEENVAFDTKGHCFMTEDGIETGNEFLYNLGAQTGIPATIISDVGPNGNETDGEPATFWITNPTNIFVGNVAAGSEHSGYWFEPKLRGIRASFYPNYDPMYEPLTQFRDNVAHSNSAGRFGAIRTYTPGYRPVSMATLEGLKIYRNIGSGIVVHRCHNITVANSLFADNYIGIDIDRAEGIEVQKTIIVGESDSYRTLMARQNVEPACDPRSGDQIGLQLYTWKVNTILAGAKITDVEFHGFDDTSACDKVSSVAFDDQNLKDGLFEFYSKFQGIRFYSNTSGVTTLDRDKSLNLCLVQSDAFKMIYVVDLDGSLGPSNILTSGPSTLLASDDQQLLEFVDVTKCTYVDSGCYNYCQDTCFRSVRYSYEGPGQANLMLKVCKIGESSQCSSFPGGRRGRVGAHEYIAHLPVGFSYNAILLDSAGHNIESGSLVESYEDSSACPEGTFNVEYIGPLPMTPKTEVLPIHGGEDDDNWR